MSSSGPRHAAFWIIWGALTAALIALIPSTRFGIPVWELPRVEMLPFLVLTAGFVLCLAQPLVLRWFGRRASIGQIVLWCVAVYGVLFMLLTWSGFNGSKRVFGELLALAIVLLPWTFAMGSRVSRAPVLAALGVAAAAALAGSLYLAYGPRPKTPQRVTSTILNTAFYNLEMRAYDGFIPKPAVPGGGGLARIDDRYLLATGDGHLYLFNWSGSNEDLNVKPLPYHIPLNGEEFSKAVGLPYERPRETILDEAGGETTGPQIDTWRFRVSSIVVQERGNRIRLFAGHHYWMNAQRCFIVRVSMAESDRDAFMNGTADLKWKTLFDSKPCLPVEGELRERASPFEGNLSGGVLALRDPDTLLFTVGFHGFDGVGARQLYSQDPNADWGTVVQIHIDEGTSETFSIGHRNEQGLYVDPQGGIWETEHGPRGGDELNFLKQGGNYGWPYVTYGTDYTSLAWPLSKSQGRHDGYLEPVYAWVPSIGVSNLTSIQKDLMPVWQGDLLVSSLRAESLFRMHIVDGRTEVVEPIPIQRRIRTLLEGDDGRIILWTEDAALVSIKPASGTSGQLLFATTCGGCHKTEGATHIYGPDLLHVYGRSVGTASGYNEYSPAMRRVGGKWNETLLDKFIANPQAAVPGTVMPFAGLADPVQRHAIIDYLKSLND
jgi:cytochrome c2